MSGPRARRGVDLHLHTTASDGRATPEELARAAHAAGLDVIAVTDHDTLAAVAEVRRLAAPFGITTVEGIEITAVDAGRDVHVLGYFVDPANARLAAFLDAQRAGRLARVHAIAARLTAHGIVIDAAALAADAAATSGRSIGRPQIARAMVAAGYVRDTREAFDRWLAAGQPGFVPREGAPSEAVIEVVHHAGGLASLAHPGRTTDRDRVAELCDAGLDALEVFHPDHDETLTLRYAAIARQHALLMTGGSDFHGDPGHGAGPGTVRLPAAEWERLANAARPRP